MNPNKNIINNSYHSRMDEIYKKVKKDKRRKKTRDNKIMKMLNKIQDTELRDNLRKEIYNNRLLINVNEIYLTEIYYKEGFKDALKLNINLSSSIIDD